jgi:ATP-dependent RNA helicase RhlE
VTQEPAPEGARPKRKQRRRRKSPGDSPPEEPVAGEDEDITSGEKPALIPGLGAPESFEFMNMHPHLGQMISTMGFEEPTPIQRRAVPEIMQGRDIIGLAQTGTGKTIAFLIPSLHRLITAEKSEHRPRVLVLAPTRELAVQVAEEARILATHSDLRIATIYGGVSMQKQISALRRGADVIVATPGRLLDHIRRNNVRLNGVEIAVLDEADRMLDMGFLPDIRTVFSHLPRKRQTLLFSATMPPAIESLSLDFQNDPKLIEVARRTPPATIDQILYRVERHLKTPLLLHLLENQQEEMRRVLVFTETKSEADILERKLREAGVSTALMHGDRSQKEREQALEKLRANEVRVLVATNVAARGLDIAGISHIVNYDMPQTVDEYVHRIGRTARGEAEGAAYTFVTLTDRGMVKRIESVLEQELEPRTAEGFDYDVPAPSWAKPSAEELIERLNEPQGIADRFRRMMGRRR